MPEASRAMPVSRSGSLMARARDVPWGPAIAILSIAALSWPAPAGPARSGVDPSWAAGLHLAIATGVHFGSDLVWTYGPLGFLAWAWPWFGPETFLAFAFVGVIWVSVCAVIFVGARRVLPIWLAAIVTYAAARASMVLQPYEALLILVFVACAVTLLRRERPLPEWVVALGGVSAGIGFLGKLNSGVFIGAIVLVTVVAAFRPRWRGLAILLLSAAGTVLGLWVVTGQRFADLPSYVSDSYEIIRGYSEAMGGPTSPPFIGVYLLLVLLVAGIAAPDARRRPMAQRIGLVVIGGLMAFAFFKVTFVRWNIGYTMAALLVVLIAVGSVKVPRLVFLGVFVTVLAVSVATARQTSPVMTRPSTAIISLAREASVAIAPWRWAGAEERTRQQLRVRYALEPEILEALRGSTVHVDPWETAVLQAWPDLRWRPQPVFQSYSAYTPRLDDLNASVLRGADAPQRILRKIEEPQTGVNTASTDVIEGRSRWFEAPLAMLETFCRYDEVVASADWEVLGLVDRRCAWPEPLGTVEARPGETVAVPTDPRPDRFVIARVHGIEDSALEHLVTALYKSPLWYVTLDGARTYRLVPGTAEDGLLMAVPTSIARAPGGTFGPPTRSMSIDVDEALVAPGPLVYEFLSVPLVRP
jgi:hypothetical protein